LVTKPLDHSEVVLRINNLLENRFLHVERQKQTQLLEEQVRERTAQLQETLKELRSTQEHVVQHERLSALGMMAGGIVHDFNNALTMILGYGELLLPYLKENAPTREMRISESHDGCSPGRHSGRQPPEGVLPPGDRRRNSVAVDLNSLIEQTISLTTTKWKETTQAEGVQIEMVTEFGDVPSIAGNAAELREVLTNLIFNAVDAMPDGGRVAVATSIVGEYVRIAVRDTRHWHDRERTRALSRAVFSPRKGAWHGAWSGGCYGNCAAPRRQD
jgi:signal transduction histidine kinase